MNTRTALVQGALQEVARLRSHEFRGSDAAVCSLLDSYSTEGSLADLLWSDLPSNCDLQDVADLLSLWSWRTNDNGSQIMRAVERWIVEGTDLRKISVALSLDALPFIDPEVAIAELKRVMAKFPQFESRCEAMIQERLRQIERGQGGHA